MSSNKLGLIDAHLGERLKARRKDLQLKQADLARALHVSIQQIHKYETAKSSLAASALVVLSRVLVVEPAYFFAGLEGAEAFPDSARSTKPALG